MTAVAEAPTNSPNRYYQEDAGGNVNFLDPVTGEALRFDTIPTSLLTDEGLKTGYDFLARHGLRIHFTTMLSRHSGANALAEAGVDLQGEANRLSKAGGVLFLEWSRKSATPELAQASATKQHKAEVGHHLAGTGLHIELPDYSFDSTRPADQTLVAWWEDIKSHSPETADSIRMLGAQLAMYVAFQMYRDWYLVGKIGSALANLDVQGRLGEDIEADMLVGFHHPGVGEHMRATGARVDYLGSYENLSESDTEIVRAITSANGTWLVNERTRCVASIMMEHA